MHFLNAIIVALIGGAAGFTLPAGLKDGVYSAHYDKEGREVHERLAPSDESTLYTRWESSGLQARAQEELFNTYCGCGFTLDPGDCDAAVADLSNQLNNGGNGCASVPSSLAWYSIRGSVVAFVCNNAVVDFRLCGLDYGNLLKTITSACGLYIAGTEQIVIYEGNLDAGYGPAGSVNSGYMRYSNGLDFCANADTSPASHC